MGMETGNMTYEKISQHLKNKEEGMNMESNETTHKVIKEHQDSLEIGTPGKGGAVKIYGDFEDLAAFKAKIDAAKQAREYAQVSLNL